MYDLHATLKMEGGKMRLELVVECAYDDGNKQASMNLTTPPDQHDNIYTDARHYCDGEFDAVYDEDEEEDLPCEQINNNQIKNKQKEDNSRYWLSSSFCCFVSMSSNKGLSQNFLNGISSPTHIRAISSVEVFLTVA